MQGAGQKRGWRVLGRKNQPLLPDAQTASTGLFEHMTIHNPRYSSPSLKHRRLVKGEAGGDGNPDVKRVKRPVSGFHDQASFQEDQVAR